MVSIKFVLFYIDVRVYFPFGNLGQVWYLIVSILDLCCLFYFYTCAMVLSHVLVHMFSRTTIRTVNT